METKHTPGPWKVSDQFNCEIVAPNRADRVAETYRRVLGFKYWPSDEAVANARLIAAAPDLLAALLALDADWTAAIPHGPGSADEPRIFSQKTLGIWRDARAAIAKATQP